MRTIKQNLTLLESTTTPSASHSAVVSNCDEISVQLITNSTDFKVEFEVSLDNTHWVAVEGIPMNIQSDWATNTTVSNILWSFDISTCEFFRCNLSTINNGTMTIIATSYQI